MEGVVPLSSLMNHSIARSQAGSKNPILRKKSKKSKRSKTGILSIEHHVGIYDVISELAKASCGLTFGQLARGDAEEAKKRLRRMLSPSAKKKRTVAAPVGEIPRRLKIIRIAVSGTDAESLFDSGAIPNLLSSSLCQRLSLEVIKTDRRITVANGNKTGVTGIVTDVPISLGDNLIVSMDFLVIDNPPFDVIIGQPALEALQAIIDFGKQEVRLTVGPNSTILGFEYAGESLPKDNVSGTDSEDFTSGSDAAPSEASDDEADVADYFVGLITECEEEPSFVADEHEDEERKKENLLESKFEHFAKDEADVLKRIVSSSGTVAWSIKDLRPADVPVRHHFDLTDNTPIHHRARRLAPKHNDYVRKEIDDMLEAGIIVPATTARSFPVVIAAKKDGKPRFCVDYRTSNRVMKADRWPLPRIEEIFDDLQGSTVFTTLDLFSGYWQVKMEETSKEMTSFVTRYGTYQFEVMPFGLMNAPATFQRMMDFVLQDIPFVRVYIDDVVIFSKSLEEHVTHLKEVMGRISENGLKIKLSKCFFAQPKIRLLGHVVDKDGIHVDDDKVVAIKDTPTPTTKTELRSFLGLAGYYRRFIRNFAEISAALHRETSGTGKLIWTNDMAFAFESLKKKLTEPPVLAFPDFDSPFVVETDASNVSLGAVLAQKKSDGKIHPVQYASRTMTDAERNYSTSEREALAVIFALKKFRVYLLSSIPFKIVTDHQALRYSFQKKDIHGRLARWLDFLAEYDFLIEYRPGKNNGSADFLSRISLGDGSQVEGEDELLCLATLEVNENDMEIDFIQVANYILGARLDGDESERRRIRRIAKHYFVWNGDLFRRRFSGLVTVPPISRRPAILKHYHDEIGHWDAKSTAKLVMKRFWWPDVYKEIGRYVKSCEDCQRMGSLPAYRSALKTPLTTLFDVFSIDFAGPLPTSRTGNKYMLVCVEHLTGWPITI